MYFISQILIKQVMMETSIVHCKWNIENLFWNMNTLALWHAPSCIHFNLFILCKTEWKNRHTYSNFEKEQFFFLSNYVFLLISATISSDIQPRHTLFSFIPQVSNSVHPYTHGKDIANVNKCKGISSLTTALRNNIFFNVV